MEEDWNIYSPKKKSLSSEESSYLKIIVANTCISFKDLFISIH